MQILKATQSADSAFSESKILRKKCVNRYDLISRQKGEFIKITKIWCSIFVENIVCFRVFIDNLLQ